MEENNEKILVVDDEPEVCNLIRDVLESAGYKVETSYTGNECLEKLNNNSYSAILLDIMMPGLGGEDVLKILRKKGNDIPIIYVTIKPKLEVDLSNVNGFVQKPFKNEKLVEVVKDII